MHLCNHEIHHKQTHKQQKQQTHSSSSNNNHHHHHRNNNNNNNSTPPPPAQLNPTTSRYVLPNLSSTIPNFSHRITYEPKPTDLAVLVRVCDRKGRDLFIDPTVYVSGELN